MKRYYKVHKSNLKFLDYITQEQLEVWYIVCDEIDYYYGFIYIGYDEENALGYMHYNDYSIRYFKRKNYMYMGEFTARKQKLEKLKEMSNEI